MLFDLRRLRWSHSIGPFVAAVLMGACAACSSGGGDGPSGQGPGVTFGAAPPQQEVAAADVSGALAELDASVEVTREVRRCVRLRLSRDAALVGRVSAGREGAVEGVVADCGQALSLAPTFVSGVADPGASVEVRECLRDLFVSLSAVERMGVTQAVTGVGSGDEVEAAATLVAGVEECRSGGN